jgi:site-specific DNA-cytosine methylase
MTHASVFSGIGGPEVAASMLGWENLFHCEINPFGRKVLDYWFPNAESYEDITKTDFSKGALCIIGNEGNGVSKEIIDVWEKITKERHR